MESNLCFLCSLGVWLFTGAGHREYEYGMPKEEYCGNRLGDWTALNYPTLDDT